MPSVLRDLADLVLPVTCAGCGAPGPALCALCLRRWSAPPQRCEHLAGRLDRMDGTVLPVVALAVNTGSVRRAVGAWKDGGRADLTPWFAAVAARAVPGVETALAGVARAGVAATGAVDRMPLVVVPAPPSPHGLARRGEDLVARVAGTLAGGIGRSRPATVERALRLGGRGSDQVGLGVRGRAANLAGRVRVRRRSRPALAGADVLLVDDVLTTGATLAACRSALEAVGARPVGAVVLAVTPPPGASGGRLEPAANRG